MKARFPLYARILGWFFLNIGLIGTGVYFAFSSSRAGEWLVMQQADPRLQSLTKLLLSDLQVLPADEWGPVLRKYGEVYDMKVALYGGDGVVVAGESLVLPDKVRVRLNDRPIPMPVNPGGPGPGFGGRPGQPSQPERPRLPGAADPQPLRPGGIDGNRSEPNGDGGSFNRPRYNDPRTGIPGEPGGFVPRGGGAGGNVMASRPNPHFDKIVEHTDSPDAWWFVVRVPLRLPMRQGPASLVLMTESLASGGLLVDFGPWLWGGAGLMVLSALLWIPFVRSITRQVSRMKAATDRIADGEFDVAVPDRRRDELGELAGGINRMARRLSGFVSGQKRFLGDIAHELCTPLARMQMGGAALEQRAPDDLKERVADLTEEVEAMSRLVGELLDFSRAGLAPQSVALTSVALEPLITRLAEREGFSGERLVVSVPPDAAVQASEGLFSRALANVFRNAARYAGSRAVLTIRAESRAGEIILTVSDDGPGVPADALPRLFDPFFRPESDRARETGGAGLGLAIVRTCIESCQGSVSARNGDHGGLEIRFVLAAGLFRGDDRQSRAPE